MEEPDDLLLWEAFSTSTLPHPQWTHRAHLRVAWLFSARYPLDDAHILMRVGIVRLNAFHGLVETAERGYHETLTRVWLVLVRDRMRAAPSATSSAFVDACGDALAKDAVFRHYSRELVLGRRARAVFVAPDRLALPELPEPTAGA
jgi:hypothetical protein